MEFEFSEMQQLYRDQLREFVQEEIVGENLDWSTENFPEDVFQSLVDMGIMGIHLPESAGGDELDAETVGLVYEELGRGDVGLATLLIAENLVNKLLYENGNERHREIAVANSNGELHLCFGLTEPSQGSDAQSLDTTATETEDGWEISGAKTATTGAMYAEHCLVFARVPDVGIRTFLVPLSDDAIEVTRYPGMGCEVDGWGELHLDDVTVPADALVSEKNGFKMAMEAFDKSRAWIALYSLGAAQQTIDETIAYLKDREAFGSSLASFEGPQFDIAEIQTHVECARLKSYETLWEADNDIDNTMHSAMAKWYAPETSVEAIRRCLVLHGHYGYSKEFGIEKRLRDVQGQQIGDGTPHVQKLVIAREIFGREYLPY
jgi:cyclohexanecarboxyl-CoA dehydrogenase